MNWGTNMMAWGNHPYFGAGVGILAIWSLVWKGLALWKAARNDERYWYVALLVINTAGILEILYLFFFAKEKFVLVSSPKSSSKKSKK